MARRKRETLDDLLRPILDAERLTIWCKAHGLKPFTVLRIRTGANRATTGTVALLVAGLVAEGVLPDAGPGSFARVRAACEASRAAAG